MTQSQEDTEPGVLICERSSIPAREVHGAGRPEVRAHTMHTAVYAAQTSRQRDAGERRVSAASKASPPTLVREVGWVALQARSWSPGLCILLAPPDLPAQREGSKERRGGQSHPGSVLGLRRPPPVLRMLGC